MANFVRFLVVVLVLNLACDFSRATDAPPAVQMFVPGFTVRELPVKLTNLVNIEYASDGRLFAAGYDSVLRDIHEPSAAINTARTDEVNCGFRAFT